MPSLDPDLLFTHLEYAAWAASRTLAVLDKLPPEAITRRVDSSFPSILATLQHIYQAEKYYFIHMQGGSVEPSGVATPSTYEDLKEEWPKLHAQMLAWAKSNFPERMNAVLTGWAQWPTWMVVMHIANHATHHLGQVVTLVRQAGYEPAQTDWTDLILYYLQRYPQERARV